MARIKKIKVNNVTYDVGAPLSEQIEGLSDGSDNFTDNTVIVTSNSSGNATDKSWYKRNALAVWNWIKTKCDALYVDKATADSRYASSIVDDGVYWKVQTNDGSTISQIDKRMTPVALYVRGNGSNRVAYYIDDGNGVNSSTIKPFPLTHGMYFMMHLVNDVNSACTLSVNGGTAIKIVRNSLNEDYNSTIKLEGNKTYWFAYDMFQGGRFVPVAVEKDISTEQTKQQIEQLTIGDTTPTDDCYILTSHYNNPSSGNWYRRPISLIWNYIRNKCNSLYATISNLETKYDKSGGTIDGDVNINGKMVANGGVSQAEKGFALGEDSFVLNNSGDVEQSKVTYSTVEALVFYENEQQEGQENFGVTLRRIEIVTSEPYINYYYNGNNYTIDNIYKTDEEDIGINDVFFLLIPNYHEELIISVNKPFNRVLFKRNRVSDTSLIGTIIGIEEKTDHIFMAVRCRDFALFSEVLLPAKQFKEDTDELNNGVAIGKNSFAVNNCIAIGLNSTAFCEYTNIDESCSIGCESVAGNGSCSIGRGSFAFYESCSIGVNSFAGGSSCSIGANSFAKGTFCTTIGYESETDGLNNISIGRASKIGDCGNSCSIGAYSEITSDFGCTIGTNSKVSKKYSTAIGSYSEANGEYSCSIGASSKTNGYCSCSPGTYSSANGNYSMSIGYYSKANSPYSVTIGRNSVTSGENGIAIGCYSEAIGKNSMAIGYNSKANAQGSLALGDACEANANVSVSLGEQTKTYTLFQTAIGVLNATTSSIFVIGNGNVNTGARSNCFEVGIDGSVYLYNNSQKYKLNMQAMIDAGLLTQVN